jgi:Trypsin-co-occurring domain 1
MKQLVEFALTDDDFIIVEVDATSSGRSPMRGLTQTQVIVERAGISFDQALDKLKPAASRIISKLRDLAEHPDEISVEFGIKLNATAGAVVASAGVEANYVVKLVWKQPRAGTG